MPVGLKAGNLVPLILRASMLYDSYVLILSNKPNNNWYFGWNLRDFPDLVWLYVKSSVIKHFPYRLIENRQLRETRSPLCEILNSGIVIEISLEQVPTNTVKTDEHDHYEAV